MFRCDNADQLIKLIREKRIIIYGSGYTATLFLEILKKYELENNIFCFAVSKIAQSADRYLGKFKINQINEIDVENDMLVCVAVHESFVREIEEILRRRKVANYVWITPLLFDLYYGNPIKRGVPINIGKLIPKDKERYALAVRWAAIDDYYGKCPNGFAWYKRAIAYLHNASAADARAMAFTQLIQNWELSGYDGSHEIAINDNYEILDGEHRVAVALYHGEEIVNCRIYRGKNINSEKSLMKRQMLIESGFSEDEIKCLDSINDYIKKRFV